MADMYQREKVRRTILEPMQARWIPPKGRDREAVLADYVDDLGEFDEDTLSRAFVKVRRDHEFASWPAAATFRKACRAIQPSGPSVEADDELVQARDRTLKAWRLAHELTTSEKFVEAGFWSDGLFSVARKEIVERICDDLRHGGDGDPKITQGDMRRWREQAAAVRSGAPVRVRGMQTLGSVVDDAFEFSAEAAE